VQPAVYSTLAARGRASQSLAAEEAGLARTEAAVAAARSQCAAASGEVNDRSRSSAALGAGAKSAAAALAAAQAAEEQTVGEIKRDNLDLVKWRAAAARLTADPQYASRKADVK